MWIAVTLVLFISLSLTVATSCPMQCSCSSRFKRVSCIGKNLDEPPDGIPTEVTELYLAQNKFTTLKESFLPALPNLIILDLKSNLIGDIQPNAFSNLPMLHILYLTNNVLSQVSSDAFRGLSNLGRLYLSQNKLTSIPDFQETPNLTYLTLDYNKLTSAKFTDGATLKKLTSIILSQNPIGSLKSDDFKVLTKSPVSNFNLNHCQLKYVENDTFLPFKSLQSLSLSYNDFAKDDPLWNVISSLSESAISSIDLSGTIQSLPRGVFEPLAASKSFRTLKLRQCDIRVLFNDTFKPLSSLYYLDFAYSRIAKVEHGTFVPLSSLKQLNLGYNRLETLPTPFPINLQTLDLSNNHGLYEVPKNSFPVSAKLETLKLSYCSLRIIYKDSFKYLTHVSSLDLSNNQLADTSIAKDAFVDMVSLHDLDLSKNKLKQMTTNAGVFNGLKSLKTLNMSNNDCSQLPNAVFNPLTGLQVLDLRLNSLGSFLSMDDNPLFSKLPRLYSLNLAANDLPVLTESVFQGLKNISKLFLGNNRITHWEPSTFKESINLTYLDLSMNSISVINSTSVEYFSAKTTLNLNDNPFYCWCELVWFRDWLNKTDVQFQNLSQYKCTSPREVAQTSLIQFNPSKIENDCHPPYKWVVLAAGAVVFVLVTMISIVLYRLRWKIFLCWYKKRCCCCRYELRDEEKPLLNHENCFNATILYGPDDASTDWVKDKFYPHVRDTLHLTAFMEDEHILLGSPYTVQIGKTDEAIKTSSYIFVVMSGDFIEDGRRYCEIDLTVQRFDRSRVRDQGDNIYIIPIIFPDGRSSTEARVRLQINKIFKNRCNPKNILYWSQDELDAQTLFWDRLQDIARDLGIIG